jgi:hypothetical protein
MSEWVTILHNTGPKTWATTWTAVCMHNHPWDYFHASSIAPHLHNNLASQYWSFDSKNYHEKKKNWMKLSFFYIFTENHPMNNLSANLCICPQDNKNINIYLPTYLSYSMVQDTLWKVDSYSACQTIAWFLCGTQRSLPCSQKSTTGPYPQPAKYNMSCWFLSP